MLQRPGHRCEVQRWFLPGGGAGGLEHHKRSSRFQTSPVAQVDLTVAAGVAGGGARLCRGLGANIQGSIGGCLARQGGGLPDPQHRDAGADRPRSWLRSGGSGVVELALEGDRHPARY